MLAKAEAAKVTLVEAGRYADLAAVLERDEAPIEQKIGIGRQEETVRTVEPLVGRLARSPRPDVAGDQERGIGDRR